jgi:hypothetical protein
MKWEKRTWFGTSRLRRLERLVAVAIEVHDLAKVRVFASVYQICYSNPQCLSVASTIKCS